MWVFEWCFSLTQSASTPQGVSERCATPQECQECLAVLGYHSMTYHSMELIATLEKSWLVKKMSPCATVFHMGAQRRGNKRCEATDWQVGLQYSCCSATQSLVASTEVACLTGWLNPTLSACQKVRSPGQWMCAQIRLRASRSNVYCHILLCMVFGDDAARAGCGHAHSKTCLSWTTFVLRQEFVFIAGGGLNASLLLGSVQNGLQQMCGALARYGWSTLECSDLKEVVEI
eukprot:2244467-Amphidinium_carterae.2